jgi:large subunit ribosomal protein L29
MVIDENCSVGAVRQQSSRRLDATKKIFMKFAESKDMTLVELAAKSRDLRHEMFNLRLQQAGAQLEKPARLTVLRKNIARIETRISQLRNKAKTV